MALFTKIFFSGSHFLLSVSALYITTCFLSHTRVRLWKRTRDFQSTQASQLKRESVSIDSIESSPEDHIFIPLPVLCSVERIAECIAVRFYTSMRPEIRFLLSQSYWKLIGSNKDCIALITRIYSPEIFYYLRNSPWYVQGVSKLTRAFPQL